MDEDKEWKRIFPTLFRIKSLKKYISLDTRKSSIMKKGIKNKINLINDVSGLEYDSYTIKVLKDTNIPFVLHHMQGEPKTCKKIQDIIMFFWIFMIFLRIKLNI